MSSNYHWLILTGVPFENSGGAQRAAQIAKTLINQGHGVSYIYAIKYKENRSLNIEKPSSNFQEYHVSRFNFIRFLNSLPKDKKLIILIEVPHPSFVPVIQFFKKFSHKIIYELIDPWNTELGQNWYNEYIEKRIIRLSDILTATAKNLQSQLSNKSKRTVHLIPNAYNKDLFVKSDYLRPSDLPKGPIIGYIGALWGSWFNIDLIIRLAKSFPNYNVVLIGEYLNQFDQIKLPNMYFLNLKAQKDLPAYLSYFDIGIIPFRTNKLTESINPLKVYEYLAMGVPVVSSYMPELVNIPNVYLGKDEEEFIKQVANVLKKKFQTEEIKGWLKNNNWNSRVEQILNLL